MYEIKSSLVRLGEMGRIVVLYKPSLETIKIKTLMIGSSILNVLDNIYINILR